jgi:hypothetical protein
MATTTDPVDIALGAAVVGLRVGGAAGLAAVDASRAVTRVWIALPGVNTVAAITARQGRAARVQAADSTDELVRRVAASGAIERVASQVLASIDIERIVTDVLEHPATRRFIDSLLTSPAFERLLFEILDSELLLQATDRILESPEMQAATERIASSPELRRAIAEQSSGMAKELVGGVRRTSASLDDVAELKVRGWLRRPKPQPS